MENQEAVGFICMEDINGQEEAIYYANELEFDQLTKTIVSLKTKKCFKEGSVVCITW